MPRRRITPGAREGLLDTIGVALYQPVPEAYRINVIRAGILVSPKVRKPFTDFVNVLQWLQTAVLSCKEDEIISAYCARVDLVIRRGPAYFETHSVQQVIEGNRVRQFASANENDASTLHDAAAIRCSSSSSS